MNYPSHLRAPRYCSLTHQPMFEGWVVYDGELYIKNMDDALAHAVSVGYDNLEQAYEDEYMYWTDWEATPEDEWDDVPAEAVINSLVADAFGLLNSSVLTEDAKRMYTKLFNEYKQS